MSGRKSGYQVVRRFRKVWRFLFYFNWVLTFLILYPLFFILLQKRSWWPVLFKLMRFWAKTILFNVGVGYRVRYEAMLQKGKTYVICANHTSYIDTPLTYLAVPYYFHFMGKAELTKIPLFRIFFQKMNIPVDRSSITASHKAFLRAASDLEQGISIAIFPEGTIHDNAPKLNRFKNGPFRLAIDKKVAILPITFMNNWEVLPEGRKSKNGGRPGMLNIIVHKPIETENLKLSDLESLKNQVFDTIDKTLRESSN